MFECLRNQEIKIWGKTEKQEMKQTEELSIAIPIILSIKELDTMSNEQTGSAIYNILAFNFAGQKTASDTLKQIKVIGRAGRL